MDATDTDQVSPSAFAKSGQRHCDPLPDEDERVFTPAGHPTDRAVYSLWPVASSSGYTVRGFQRRYTDEDVALLVQMDCLHDTVNGLAVKKLCERP